MMERRVSHIVDVCSQLQASSNFSCSYQNKVSKYNQEINLNNFLREFNTGTIYCYIHKVKEENLCCILSNFLKVASSTWMSFFARLENDSKFLSYAEKTGNYYKVNAKSLNAR